MIEGGVALVSLSKGDEAVIFYLSFRVPGTGKSIKVWIATPLPAARDDDQQTCLRASFPRRF